MLETLLDLITGTTALWFVAAALLLFVIAIALGSDQVRRAELEEGDYQRKAALMPAFAELQAAEASLGEKRRERDELLEELKAIHQEQAEAQRHRLDAEHWQSLAEQAKRDYENREELVAEVERLRSEYENAAVDVAARNETIADLTREQSRLNIEIEAAQERLNGLEAQLKEAEDLTERLKRLKEELSQLTDERDDRLRAAFEVSQLARRREELEQALQELPDLAVELEERCGALRGELQDLQREADRLRDIRDEVDRLQARHTALETAIETLEREKTRLEGALPGGRRVGPEAYEADENKKIADLLQKPTCLFGDDGEFLLPETEVQTNELQMLSNVETYLNELNLEFEQRVLYRFHTSLKIGFISPLTVLAGISGTGKSQLPQRYAEAMGMHFLKVAVQPRWDSPQDVLGFYNYLEQSYKATELSRALIRMDRNFKELTEDEKAADRMLIVLLDEMNLARVEYYFSEFLSRLEGRPESGVTDPEQLLPGQINFEIPRGDREPLSVYPGHNVLFVGTMNEDESTQVLSDKVLDRANTLRFRKPERLRSQTLEELDRERHAHIPFETWKSWQRKGDDLRASYREMTEDFVSELNALLAKFDRAFGHRMNQAIYAYVANYPILETESQVQRALADTVELRILPKLRGIELEDRTRREVRRIADLVKQKLDDEELADSIIRGLADGDVFTWTG